jgi:DnaJ like chaperone protein
MPKNQGRFVTQIIDQTRRSGRRADAHFERPNTHSEGTVPENPGNGRLIACFFCRRSDPTGAGRTARPLFTGRVQAHHRPSDETELPMASGLLKDIRLAIGEIFSGGKVDEEQQLTLQVVFGLLGYLARADSIVTDDEAAFLNNLMDDMNLSLSKRKIAVDAMNRGKARQIDIAVELERFMSVHPAGSPEVGKLYETLLDLAGSDGRVRPREREFLEQITSGLGFTPDILDMRLEAMARKPVA